MDLHGAHMRCTYQDFKVRSAPESPLQIRYAIVFCSELIEPEQANFQRQLLTNTLGLWIFILYLGITIFIIVL